MAAVAFFSKIILSLNFFHPLPWLLCGNEEFDIKHRNPEPLVKFLRPHTKEHDESWKKDHTDKLDCLNTSGGEQLYGPTGHERQFEGFGYILKFEGPPG